MADEAGHDGGHEKQQEHDEAGLDVGRQQNVERGGGRADVDGADDDLRQRAACRRQRQAPAEHRDLAFATCQPEDRGADGQQDCHAQQPVGERRYGLQERRAVRIDDKREARQCDNAGAEGQERDTDDAADVRRVEPGGLVNTVAHRPADQHVETDGVRNAVSNEPGKCRQAVRYPAGRNALRGHDVVERHRREADRRQRKRLRNRYRRRSADRGVKPMQMKAAGDLVNDQQGDHDQTGADQRADHARLEQPDDELADAALQTFFGCCLRFRHRRARSMNPVAPLP